jgi:hypothetical protein
MKHRLIKFVSHNLQKKSDGSAITEFLIFTIPLFVILLTITLNLYQNSMAINEAKNLARQSLRAFITSPNNELAQLRANQVIEIYRNSLPIQSAEKRTFDINFICSKNPCLSPGGEVSAQLEITIAGSPTRKILGKATEYVDIWR